jgi:hypothetical protein
MRKKPTLTFQKLRVVKQIQHIIIVIEVATLIAKEKELEGLKLKEVTN